MSTKHIRTTGDLVRFGAALRIDCRGCGATRTLTSTEAVAAFRSVALSHVLAKAKCSRCGKKEATVIVLPPL